VRFAKEKRKKTQPKPKTRNTTQPKLPNPSRPMATLYFSLRQAHPTGPSQPRQPSPPSPPFPPASGPVPFSSAHPFFPHGPACPHLPFAPQRALPSLASGPHSRPGPRIGAPLPHPAPPASAPLQLTPALTHSPWPTCQRPSPPLARRLPPSATDPPAPPGRPVFLAVTPAGAPVHAAQPRSPLSPVDHPSSAGPPTSYTRALSF